LARHENRATLAWRGDQLGARVSSSSTTARAPRGRRRRDGTSRRRPLRSRGSSRRAWRRPAGRPAGLEDREAEPLVERRIGEGPGVVEEPRLRGVIDRPGARPRAGRRGRARRSPHHASASSPAAPAITVGHRVPAAMAPNALTSVGTALRRSSVPTASTNGRPASAPAMVDGIVGDASGGRGPRWTTLDARVAPSTSRTCVACVTRRVDGGAGPDPPPQHLAARRTAVPPAPDGQEPAVVRPTRRSAGGSRDDVVGAVDHLGVAKPAVDAGPIGARPQLVGDRCRQREPSVADVARVRRCRAGAVVLSFPAARRRRSDGSRCRQRSPTSCVARRWAPRRRWLGDAEWSTAPTTSSAEPPADRRVGLRLLFLTHPAQAAPAVRRAARCCGGGSGRRHRPRSSHATATQVRDVLGPRASRSSTSAARPPRSVADDAIEPWAGRWPPAVRARRRDAGAAQGVPRW